MFRPLFRALPLRDRADASAHHAKRGGRSTNTLDPAVLSEPAGGHPTSFVAYCSVACTLLVPVPLLETLAAELPLDAIEGSWPYNLLERVSLEVVAREHVREGAKTGLLLLVVDGMGMPASLVTKEGRVGVLLGLESRRLPRQFPTPFGYVRLVTVKALLPAELEYVAKRGAEGTNELARRFAETEEEHVSRASRQAVV